MGITFEQVSYFYQKNTPLENMGLNNVSIQFLDSHYIAIVGHTGSGKSTLIQHLNALLKPSIGQVKIEDHIITNQTKEKHLKSLRQLVGIVFQFPEAQLFEETVLQDVMFGPKNFGASEEEAKKSAIVALKQVGIDEALFQRSPFSLSGGQMRRVAIAGVLAMNPKILVLDEPTAGLDPRSAKQIMDMFYRLYKEKDLTIILVTHQMDDVAKYADQVAVMHSGEIVKFGNITEVFANEEWLKKYQINQPNVIKLKQTLEKLGISFENTILNEQDLVKAIVDKVVKT